MPGFVCFSQVDDKVLPGAYAVVGAASLVSGATHTISTAVVVFEITGQLHMMIPTLIAVLIAYSVSGSITVRLPHFQVLLLSLLLLFCSLWFD